MFAVSPTNYKRSTRTGLFVSFEAYPGATGSPVTRFEIRMVDAAGNYSSDPVWTYTAGPPGTNRGFQPKPSINGLWFVEVTAIDEANCRGVGRSASQVRVFQ